MMIEIAKLNTRSSHRTSVICLYPAPITKARSAKATPWITLSTIKQLGYQLKL